MSTKICSMCKIDKDVALFSKYKNAKDGLKSSCKACNAIKSKEYSVNNKDKLKLYGKEYRELNKSTLKLKSAAYYSKNKSEIRDKRNANASMRVDYYKQYRLNNSERISKYQKEYRNTEENIIKRRKYANNYMQNKLKNEPLFRVSHNIKRAIGCISDGIKFTKKSHTYQILGCSYNFFLNHITSQFTDAMSVEKLGKEIHLDHIIPVSSAATENELLRLNHWSNFQPLWAKDNLAKSDTMPSQEIIDEVNMIYECCMLQ